MRSSTEARQQNLKFGYSLAFNSSESSVSMETELKSLEEKIFLLLRLYQDTRIENKKLREELADSYAQCEKLNEKIHVAAGRLETLLLNIPDNEQ